MFNGVFQYNTNIKIASGKLLLSEPLLQDESFQRSVVYVCHHDINESIGFIINKKADADLSQLIPALENSPFPLYIGGPVGLESINMIHNVPALIGGEEIADGIYWGGSLEKAIEGIVNGDIVPTNCKMFIGYSGWGKGQLQSELDVNSWLVSDASLELVFKTDADTLWKKSIAALGQQFNALLHMPTNPALN